MPPVGLSYLYCTQADVENVLSAVGVQARLDDDGDGYVNTTEQARMTDAINRATETCNFYLYNRYTPQNLSFSNIVNEWCSDLAAYVLCRSRGNPVPDAIIEAAQDAKDDMKEVLGGRIQLPAVPLRRWLAPTWDNIRVDLNYRFRVIRVEFNTSSQMPTTRPLNPDWADAFTYEV